MEDTALTSQSSSCPKDYQKIPIMKDGMATCLRCNNVGVKDTFYGKGKQYCSANCVRGLPPPSSSLSVPLFKIPANNSSSNSTSTSPSSSPPSLSSTSTSSALTASTLTTATVASSASITTPPLASTLISTSVSTSTSTLASTLTSTTSTSASPLTSTSNSSALTSKSASTLASACTLASASTSISTLTPTSISTSASTFATASTLASSLLPESLPSEVRVGGADFVSPTEISVTITASKFTTTSSVKNNTATRLNLKTESVTPTDNSKSSVDRSKFSVSCQIPQPNLNTLSESSHNLNEDQVQEKKVDSKQVTMNNNLSKKKSNCNSCTKSNVPRYLLNTFNWLKFFEKSSSPISSTSVSSFKHCPLADVWDNIISLGLKVEVKNNDISLPKNSEVKQEFYWIASVIEVTGYFILLRYEGFDDSSNDFWVNIFTNQVHPVGWCATQGNVLIPPRLVAEKCADWKATLVKRLTGSRTLPENFYEQLQESIKSRFKVGMKLEVVDKRRISAVRVASIDKIIGNRLHLKYEGEDETDTGFWCHEQSPLIHPIGWAQVIGHELKATREYARRSLEKTIEKNFDENDADWDLFPIARPHAALSNSEQKFKEGMKLEAIDPLNLSTICVATVTKVLRNNYLMVGIDGMMAVDGSDWFCYHVSSPNIFPVGFCMLNDIPLTPPRGYPKKFDWFSYLKETQSIAAPVHLFKKDIPNHGFSQGMYLEAVDLMVPRLVCVATVTKVVGRLLRIHFNGWDETYDQWCDCESPELYPIGWCEMVGYPLEPPKDSDVSGLLSPTLSRSIDSMKKKRNNYKGRYKKRRRGGYSGSSDLGSPISTGRTSLDKASTSDLLEYDTYLSSMSFNNGDWLSPTSKPTNKESSSPSFEMSNSSVIVKPSPVEPFYSEPGYNKSRDDPKQWSVTEVCQFLRDNECGAYCQSFWNEVSLVYSML